MNDPHELGLDDLGQRVQALGDPANEQRRYYRGAPLPIGPSAGGRVISPFDAIRPTESVPSPRAAPPPQEQPLPIREEERFAESALPQPQSAQPVAPPFAPVVAPAAPPAQASAPTAPPSPFPAAPAAPASGQAGAQPSASPTQPLLASGSSDDSGEPKTGLQRAVAAVRTALPFVQKLLPLLDGNFASAVSALLSPMPAHHTPPPAPVKVDLEPVERGLAELRTGQRELRGQVQEQVTALKRVEDQLERVREATDRNTLEQQEMVEDLRAVGSRISNLAIAGVVLLALSLGLNIYFLIQLQHILR